MLTTLQFFGLLFVVLIFGYLMGYAVLTKNNKIRGFFAFLFFKLGLTSEDKLTKVLKDPQELVNKLNQGSAILGLSIEPKPYNKIYDEGRKKRINYKLIDGIIVLENTDETPEEKPLRDLDLPKKPEVLPAKKDPIQEQFSSLDSLTKKPMPVNGENEEAK